MKIHTWGDPKDPAVLLIHPMLFNGRQMIERLGRKIPGSFYLIAPDQGGHGEDQETYAPAKDAEELLRFLREKGISRVEILYAASMGGVMAMHLLKLGGIFYQTVRLEGIPLGRIGRLKAMAAVAGLLAARRKARKDPASLDKVLARVCGKDTSRMMAEQLGRLSRQNVCRIQWACVYGCAVPVERTVCGRMTFEWGEKEINVVLGKPLAERMYPWAEIIVLPGKVHCERFGTEPEAVAGDLAG